MLGNEMSYVRVEYWGRTVPNREHHVILSFSTIFSTSTVVESCKSCGWLKALRVVESCRLQALWTAVSYEKCGWLKAVRVVDSCEL
jgi:hypothetical protein